VIRLLFHAMLPPRLKAPREVIALCGGAETAADC